MANIQRSTRELSSQFKKRQSAVMQTIEAKEAAGKERHRRNMARKRAAFKANLDSWREELDTLSGQQFSLLEAYWDRQSGLQQERHTLPPPDVDKSPACEEQILSTTKTSSLCDAYVCAVELGNAIHVENEEIKKRLDEYEKFESRLHRDVAQLESSDRDDLTGDSRRLRAVSRLSSQDDELFYYEAVDASTCHDIVRRNYPLFWDHHARFMQDATLTHQPFFGWDARRLVNNGHHFHFLKRIPCNNGAKVAEFIGDEAWRIFNTSELYERLYTSRVTMHVWQRIDDNTTMALQSLPAADNSMSRRCLTLASKILNMDEAGHRIVTVLLLGVAPNEDVAKRNESSVQFVQDTNAYLVLHQRVDDDGHEFVEMAFGLHGQYASDAEARFGFLETASALVRFEQMVLPHDVVVAED